MFFATTLKYYKRPEVQEAIVRHANDREVSPRFGSGFGKRPDVVVYPADVFALAQRKASSFHCSEERWRDPLQIQTGMSRKQLDDLRTGWDLVLDIDCPHWEFSKLTTLLFVRALQAHNITSITCKFSGSKGFHIGVPFEAFPSEINNTPTRVLFPEGPRAIAEYLLQYIQEKLLLVKENEVTFLPGDKDISYTLQQLKEFTIEGKDFSQLVCSSCSVPWKKEVADRFCPSCQAKVDPGVLRCSNCSFILEQVSQDFSCKECGASTAPIEKINFASLIEVDTILLASRHLFRMPFSLHEKTSLVSVPIALDNILSFEKDDAHPDKVDYSLEFLPRKASAVEGADLLGRALNLHAEQQAEQLLERKKYEKPEEAIEDDFFPPCMRLILAGIRDGKKRALFILTNFLYSAGWTSEMIKDALYEWNDRNPEKLREVILKSHLELKAKKKEAVPPPNCTSDYYKALGVCQPDDFCRTIKNPIQYTTKKWRLANFKRDGTKKAERVKLTDEQKEMRRQYREKIKAEKS